MKNNRTKLIVKPIGGVPVAPMKAAVIEEAPAPPAAPVIETPPP